MVCLCLLLYVSALMVVCVEAKTILHQFTITFKLNYVEVVVWTEYGGTTKPSNPMHNLVRSLEAEFLHNTCAGTTRGAGSKTVKTFPSLHAKSKKIKFNPLLCCWWDLQTRGGWTKWLGGILERLWSILNGWAFSAWCIVLVWFRCSLVSLCCCRGLLRKQNIIMLRVVLSPTGPDLFADARVVTPSRKQGVFVDDPKRKAAATINSLVVCFLIFDVETLVF